MIQTATVVLPVGRLTAAADPGTRTLEGLLVPWGEVGRPTVNGAGRAVSVRRGALTLTAAVAGIDTHDRPRRDVSTLVAHEVREDGIWGRVQVDTTDAGDRLLAAIAAGDRSGLSVEASGLLLDPTTDEVVGGTIDLYAHVDTPAFSSARVHTMTAALAVDTPTAGEAHVTAPTTTTEVTPTPTPAAAPELDYGQLAAALAPMLAAAAAPAGLPTGGALTAPVDGPAATEDAVTELATLQAAQASGDTSMMAALADITNSQLPIFQRPAGAVGAQLWQNHSFTRRFVPLLNAKPLTSYKVTGWEFGTGPEVGDWAGDKTEIPTNDIGDPVEIETTAKRIAGGWDIDRKFRDFGDAAFWAWFYAQQTESYARKSDAKARAALLAAAVDITTGATIARYTRPTGYTPVAQADVLRAVAYGTAYLEDTPLVEKAPDYVLMNTQDWLGLLDLTNLDLPTFLSMLNVQPGMFQRSNDVPAGSVILGVRQAVDWYELPGAAPIRVEALDVARGGVDSAVFGYWATLNVRPGGIISVPLAAG